MTDSLFYIIRKPYIVQEAPAYCAIHISPNDLPEFPSAALASLNDAATSPRSAALQAENSFCVI